MRITFEGTEQQIKNLKLLMELGDNDLPKEVFKPEESLDKITEVWCTEDILGQATEDGYKLTTEQAREVLHIVDRMHDANIGINWDNISCHIDMYCDDNKIEKEEIS